ncbi:hypothetical protein VIBNISOn1_800047 [Vibrio nigripulchritudo SOn1]|uniref:Uncharacterized protein n=1 Tax=Vibrio nigripulchritudo SOn1 TaxID=1238450 RepID=A0AAV2VXD9_9VIBR|nr:hypothetical protein VIBNISOn1_800047 [Vibrio nigripulchritudo SOn1]
MFSPTSQPIANDRKRQVIGDLSEIGVEFGVLCHLNILQTKGYDICINN